MAVTAKDIQIIRQRTNAPLLKCKEALMKADGDHDKALDILREMGAASAVKKGDRMATEGVVKALSSGSKTVILEVNSETDFAAKNEGFIAFVDTVAHCALSQQPESVEALNGLEINGQTIEAHRQELVGKIGENIQVRRFDILDAADGTNCIYQHGQKITVVVRLEQGSEEVGRDVAMQVAATNPLALDQAGIPAEKIEKEKAIFEGQIKDMDKPANVLENIIKGKINKFVEENTLLGQVFVKDSKQKVRDYLKANNAVVAEFVRYELGEGMEKKTVSFADEVEQARGSI